MDNKTQQKASTNDTKTGIYFLTITILFGIAALISTKQPLFNWAKLELPFNLPSYIMPIIYLDIFVMSAIAVYVMWTTNISHPETKFANLICHLICMTLFVLWPMFILHFNVKILALIISITLSISLIYTTYRYLTCSVWAGVFYIINTLLSFLILTYSFWVMFAI